MNWIRVLFTNDWYPVWSFQGHWKLSKGDDVFDKYSWYEVRYSPIRNRYKLINGGYQPKEHRCYPSIIQKLNEFINKNK